MQLASIALVVQSFRYGPRHLVLTGDADSRAYTTPFTEPNRPFVLGGLIHLVAAAGSVTVTFGKLLMIGIIGSLQRCFGRAHLVLPCQGSPRDEFQGRRKRVTSVR
jgi:hypothetical protein